MATVTSMNVEPLVFTFFKETGDLIEFFVFLDHGLDMDSFNKTSQLSVHMIQCTHVVS